MSKYNYYLLKDDQQIPLTQIMINGVEEFEYRDEDGVTKLVEFPAQMIAELNEEPGTESLL